MKRKHIIISLLMMIVLISLSVFLYLDRKNYKEQLEYAKVQLAKLRRSLKFKKYTVVTRQPIEKRYITLDNKI